ncbi:triose-phosphate isomerase [Nitratiruptor sp. SB155-2]|uniref:Triosephosphate isomerase n=1 Tax=Nitratiruptor sp. (strain SB155-2) TaxID=387092 RepID=TPIS_NITSB|nr:triose-phosphate isomerase [Nitratiruptor sp. SB155-2]A6Q538.1 RecName: Full=Triosephosphate isomerase; Short=TIM; Short=TPI; AltName: Full=Triose-phosphate isomerase [Nitratiruptor sp. SB155-2]BAF70597.1 triosephosphate isomerase [Nitratiruptor sp. SB155-2]
MILAANFKMNHTRASTKAYIERLNAYGKQTDIDIAVFPPATALDQYETFADIGAQNAYAAEHGSFTGEIGLQQLQEFGIETVLLGHSERRHIFYESQEMIARKFAFYKERGFTIYYCLGETLQTRKKGFEAIRELLQSQLEGIDTAYENFVIAYEPVWAIGTGVAAKPEEIEEVLAYLASLTDAPLLYGGSVKPANIKEVLSIPKCDGALIGTASWDVENFIKMIEIAKEMR